MKIKIEVNTTGPESPVVVAVPLLVTKKQLKKYLKKLPHAAPATPTVEQKQNKTPINGIGKSLICN